MKYKKNIFELNIVIFLLSKVIDKYFREEIFAFGLL